MTGAFTLDAGDVHVPAADLWLDPGRRRSRAFVSHAHGDHAGRHEYTVATPATADLMAVRLRGCAVDGRTEFDAPRREGDADVTLLPAGHILGAAQILIASEAGRLVYSGDLRLRPSLTADDCATPACDDLIMECTYGDPLYRFPERAEVVAELADDVERTLERGRVPVLLAYALGKAQEVMAALAPRGFRFLVEDTVDRLSAVYEAHGVALPPRDVIRAGEAADGRVVVFPPHRWRSANLAALGPLRKLAVTGWAMGERGRRWYPRDASYTLSDHADWDELIEYVERCAPTRVHLTHGAADALRDELRRRGFDARVL